MTHEAKVKRWIKELLRIRRVWNYSPVQMGMGVVGIPDLICCKPTLITPDMVGKTVGLFLAIEVKAPGKIDNVTPNQQARIDEIRAAGGIAFVTDSEAQIRDYLDAEIIRSKAGVSKGI